MGICPPPGLRAKLHPHSCCSWRALQRGRGERAVKHFLFAGRRKIETQHVHDWCSVVDK